MEVDFWARLSLMDGTPMPPTIGGLRRERARIDDRAFETGVADQLPIVKNWRPGFCYVDDLSVQHLIWIADRREDEFGFYALDRVKWAEIHRSLLVAGAEFLLVDRSTKVVMGRVTEATQPA